MTTKSEIIKALADASLDRANVDLATGELNWEYVLEDVKYFFRDEIAESASFEVDLMSVFFNFKQNYRGVYYV